MKKVPAELEAEIVRLHFASNMRIGEIARNVDVHHCVVRRVIALQKVPAPSVSLRASKLDAYREWMRDMLEKYPKIRATRLYAMAQQHGYQGGISIFRACVKTLRPRPRPEAFLRLTKLPGEEVQIDWGHFGTVMIGRAVRPLVMFTMTLSYSRAVYLRFFHDAKMANFQAGHVIGFRFFGGVPKSALYDNLKSAVLERCGNLKRYNPELLALASHYRFEPKAAAPRRGNEKGRVERTIRYVRDSFFAARDFVSLERLNEEALTWCTQVAAKRAWQQDDTKTVQEVWDQEKAMLLSLPDDDYPAHERVQVSVGKTPYARFDKNDYSVPYQYVQSSVSVQADDRRIRILQGDVIVAEHVRSFSKGEVIENADHVAKLVAVKRAGRESSAMSRLVDAAPSAEKWLQTASTRGANMGYQTRKLQELLRLYGAAELEAGLLQFVDSETVHLGTLERRLDAARAKQGRTSQVGPIVFASKRLENVVVQPHSIESYAVLDGREDIENHGE